MNIIFLIIDKLFKNHIKINLKNSNYKQKAINT